MQKPSLRILSLSLASLAAVLATGLIGSELARATAWKGMNARIYPRCQGNRLARRLTVEQELFLQFERRTSAPAIADSIEYLPLAGHRLSILDGKVLVDEQLVGQVDLSLLDCHQSAVSLPILPIAGATAVLHQERGDDCREQPGEIAWVDDPFTLATRFTLELSPAGGNAGPFVFSTLGVSWFNSLSECIRGRGNRAGIRGAD